MPSPPHPWEPVVWSGAAAVGLWIAARVGAALHRWGKARAFERRMRRLELDAVDVMDGFEFEDYLCRLLEAQGYVVERTGASGDLGVDLIAEREDERWAVQAKRYGQPVSRRAVSDAVAGMVHYDCDRAMVVTNSTFTRGAVELAESNGCRLVDREELAEWVEAYRG